LRLVLNVLQTDIDGTIEERNAAVYGQSKGGEEKGDDDDDDIQEQKIIKWRVENSWGTEKGDKGYLAMSDEWFNEYVFQIAVKKEYLDKSLLNILNQKPKVLPAWDPMGALASAM
jgi:hypothetical protein